MTVQNVVTYTAMIDVANPDLKLKPGMTANVTVSVSEHDDVLAVPNAALRFRPDNAVAAPARDNGGPVLWQVVNGALRPVHVKIGISDGVRTEIVSVLEKEGDAVALAATSPDKPASPAATRSPFAGGGRVAVGPW